MHARVAVLPSLIPRAKIDSSFRHCVMTETGYVPMGNERSRANIMMLK